MVPQRLAEFHDHLRIVYTPAYDPDANRSAWLWRWSRREVTHNHQRMTFAALLADIQEHFETLGQHPTLVLRQIGSAAGRFAAFDNLITLTVRAADGDERHGPFLPTRSYEDEAQCDMHLSPSPLLKHYPKIVRWGF